MNSPPTDDIDLKPEKLEEEKEGGAAFHCDLFDMDIVHKIAQEFLPGLGSACVDNTTGGLFSTPASVAVGIRKEMVDCLVQRSENFVAESVVLEGGPSEEIPKDPFDIISDFIDDFAVSKRNFFSKVSGWVMSERREDRIDDFVQEMDLNGFWLLNRREQVAQTLLKNVDFKNTYHCSMSFKTTEDLDEHKLACSFRTMRCTNEGCNAIFTAAHEGKHESVCPFKILNCDQNCGESLMRREMDRHCITTCPMKLAKCPFYSVGCHDSIPQCMVAQHRRENISSHLLYVLQTVHKEAPVIDLKERVEELLKLSSPERLAAARDGRALTSTIKDLELKLGPLVIKERNTDEVTDKKDSGSPTKDEPNIKESPRAKTEIDKLPLKDSDSKDPEMEKLVPTNASAPSELQPRSRNSDTELSVPENSKETPSQKEDNSALPNIVEKSFEETETVPHEEKQIAAPPKADEKTSATEMESKPNTGDYVAPIATQKDLEKLRFEEEESKVKDVQIASSPEGNLEEAKHELPMKAKE